MVRPARLPADVDAILALYAETMKWHATQWPDDFRSRDAELLRPEVEGTQGESSLLLVATVADRIVGFVSASIFEPPSSGLERYDGRIVWIGDVVVTVDARRQGIAGRLLVAAESWGREQGAGTVALQVHAENSPAHRLYAAGGYRDAQIKMRKEL